ncbi:hypothetical protein V6N12_032851 [Hibiscus sabdariffa]|uniref:Uncharacterized protein n=1 Tax=Hibiscus sabdariffa TaxID=183260 RepID=A0ABR2BB58_9ROSI
MAQSDLRVYAWAKPVVGLASAGLKGRAGSFLCWTMRHPPWAGSELVAWPGVEVSMKGHVAGDSVKWCLMGLLRFVAMVKVMTAFDGGGGWLR